VSSLLAAVLPDVTEAEPSAEDASRAWVVALGATGRVQDDAVARLYELLLRAARFEVRRRRATLGGQVSQQELEDLAVQATGDAVVAILSKLDTFRGESRFTTWAYKFVLLEASVKCRRRAWHQREVTLDEQDWPVAVDQGPSSHALAEQRELLDAVRGAVDEQLTPHQRRVFVALALDGVPIDVLAERLRTTRGALYKTLHDARRKLRAEVERAGLDLTGREAS
jgi:RNA polymerase sigma-70 factor (ECF subfamily)